MVVCNFFQQGRCKFGGLSSIPAEALQAPRGIDLVPCQQDQADLEVYERKSPLTQPWTKRPRISLPDMKHDLTAGQGRPEWIFSAYAPRQDVPRQLFGGPQRELSMEEMRVRHYEATAAGNMPQAVQEAEALWRESVQTMEAAISDINAAAKYIADGHNEHPNRIDIVEGRTGPAQNPPTGPVTSAFGQPGGFGQTAAPAQPSAFGQPSPFGQQPAFGQPSAPAQPSPFGQPSAFGQPSGLGKPSAFGQPSLGQPSAFGQPSTLGKPSAFGQPAALGQPSPFGQASTAGQPSPFGQVSAPGQPSPFGQAGTQPSGTGAAPNAFGQPSAPGTGPFGAPSPFGGQPTGPSPSGFGQASTGGGFGQPSQSTFGQAQQPSASPFGQPSVQANAFGAPQGVPVPNVDAGPRAFIRIEDPNQLNPLPALQGETRRDPASNRIVMWKGRPVQYINEWPCYLHPQDNKTYVRINFPDGPPDAATLRDSQGKPEEYTPEIEQMYKFYLEHGFFKDGIIPAVPPKREFINFDF
ncbi:hypothetical protein N7492_006444 [Penicillium capsulatum]|uniref:CCCH zinc finger domain protein n=1 Tax=Penicillium capsulatum TaxID=69766 RepID=A0A9W9I0T9_9EURO|nr:hypothetical protein N7492_006444 [Penicillium capsulatum]KAJ6116284.1 hypothetical protein N7512_006009 [Penicillium capsulatum]